MGHYEKNYWDWDNDPNWEDAFEEANKAEGLLNDEDDAEAIENITREGLERRRTRRRTFVGKSRAILARLRQARNSHET